MSRKNKSLSGGTGLIVVLVGVTLLSIGAVEGFYYYFGKRIEQERQERAVTAENSQQAKIPKVTVESLESLDVSTITKRNLFVSRTGDLRDASQSDPLEGMELSSLAVVLMGTVTGADNEQRAIIYDKVQRRQELYQQGDFVHQAAIKQILRGKVILSIDGRDEMLDIAEARNVSVPQVKPLTPVTTAGQVIGRPVGAAATLSPVAPDLRMTLGSDEAVPESAGRQQLRTYQAEVIVKSRDSSEPDVQREGDTQQEEGSPQ